MASLSGLQWGHHIVQGVLSRTLRMRARWVLLAMALGATLVMAGCIGEKTRSPASGGDESEGLSPAQNEEPSEAGSASKGREVTEDDTDEGPPALGNLTMDGAERSRPNASTVVFTWTGEL